jgi:hypothetical protein
LGGAERLGLYRKYLRVLVEKGYVRVKHVPVAGARAKYSRDDILRCLQAPDVVPPKPPKGILDPEPATKPGAKPKRRKPVTAGGGR